MLIVCLDINDLIYMGNERVMSEKFKKSMMLECDMSDLDMSYYILGIELV